MVAGCPKCNARYRVDADKIGPEGAKLRCTKCSAVFLVRAPGTTASVPETPVPEPPASDAPVDRSRLVLVADVDEARGKATADAVQGWGFHAILVHDGVEAMLASNVSCRASSCSTPRCPRCSASRSVSW